MSYLKRCAIAVRIESWRKQQQWRELWERLRDNALIDLLSTRSHVGQRQADSDLKQIVLSRIRDGPERVVFELTYHYGLAPRDIHSLRPDLFPDAKTVSRVKENLLKRLRRDQELCDWWSGTRESEQNDGGNTVDPLFSRSGVTDDT